MRDYQKHKEAMAQVSRVRSLLSRDIAPIPPIEDVVRRRRTRRSLLDFCRCYFPKKFTKPFGQAHLALIDRLQTIIAGRGKVAVALPRGTGKTSIVEAAIVYALITGQRRHVIVLAANTKEARKILASIKKAMRLNPLLRADYPEVCYPLYKLRGSALLARGQLYYGEPTEVTIGADSMVLPTIPGSSASGAIISALGIGAAVRGQSEEQSDGSKTRPDLILLDDLQTDKIAQNPARVEGLETMINSTIDGLAEDGVEIPQVMTCTVIQPGDLADRYLDHDVYPHWHGMRYGLLSSLPERMDLWKEYRSIRFQDEQMANDFYAAHLKEMQAGSAVTWPESFDASVHRDALQKAMNKWCDNERGFWSEGQNQPQALAGSSVWVPAREIIKRVNGLRRGMVPETAQKLTAFVDCHDDILYWVVVAWSGEFTGYVLDYGTFPEQTRHYFAKSDGGLNTLRDLAAGERTADAALREGLRLCLSDLVSRSYSREEGGEAGLDRIFVDSKYKPEVIDQALRLTGARMVIPTSGYSIRARGKPMAQFPKNPGRFFGWHWIEEKLKQRAFRTVLIDTNYWKSKVHEGLALSPGSSGSISFWGRSPEEHRMIAEHCAAERVRLVSSGTHEVNEWEAIPNQDNHYFDCMVGNMVAANSLGLRGEDQQRMRRES